MPLSLDDHDAPLPLLAWDRHVRPTLSLYAGVHQTGVREGTTLEEHLLHGALFLASALPALGMDDRDLALTLAAFTVHDANKMAGDGRSLTEVVRSEDFERLCLAHGLQAFLHDALGEDLAKHLDDLRFLVVNAASKHGRPADALLMPAPARDRLLNRLRPLLTAADIHDLSRTFDETAQKAKVRDALAAASGRSLHLVFHRVAEHLGPMSALLHTAAGRCASAKGAFPLWVYPEGTWYLAPVPDLGIAPEEVRAAYLAARGEVWGAGIRPFVDTNVKDGFKLSLDVLARFDDADLVGAMEDFARGARPDAPYKTLEGRRAGRAPDDPAHPDQLPAGLRWPSRPEEVSPGRLWGAAENLLKRVPSFRGEISAFLLRNLQATGQEQTGAELLLNIGLDPVYERPYLLAVSARNPWEAARQAMAIATREARRGTGIEVGAAVMAPEVATYLETVLTWGSAIPAASTAPPVFDGWLAAYLSGPAGRSSLGPALGAVDDLMSAETLGAAVQQFTNGLPGGSGSATKRQRDAIGAEAMAVQARVVGYTVQDPPLLLHIFPSPGISPLGWRAGAGAPARTRAERQHAARARKEPDPVASPRDFALSLDVREVEGRVAHTWEARFFGLVPTDQRLLQGNGFTLPIAPPKGPEALAWLEAAHTAAVLVEESGLRAVLTPFLSVVSPAADERLRLEGPPFLLRGLLPARVDSAGLARLLTVLDSLALCSRALRKPTTDVRMPLLRAAGQPEITALYTLDRLIERSGSGDWGAIRLVGRTLPHFRRLLLPPLLERPMSPSSEPAPVLVSTLLQDAAARAIEHRLRGSGFKRNDLLRPLNELFKVLRRARGNDDVDLLFSAAEDRIFTAMETLASRDGFGIGRAKREAVRAWIDLFRRLLATGYADSLPRLRADERLLRAAYITYVRAEIDRRTPGKEPEAETGD